MSSNPEREMHAENAMRRCPRTPTAPIRNLVHIHWHFGFLLPAVAQIQPSHGTTLVAFFSNKEIIVAEDSRIVRRSGRFRLYFDDQCKISTLGGNKAIIGFWGFLDNCGVFGKNCEWDGGSIASEISRQMQNSGADDIEGLATTWSDKMAWRLRKLYFLHPALINWDALGGTPLIGTVFAGTGKEGVLHAVVVMIGYETQMFGP